VLNDVREDERVVSGVSLARALDAVSDSGMCDLRLLGLNVHVPNPVCEVSTHVAGPRDPLAFMLWTSVRTQVPPMPIATASVAIPYPNTGLSGCLHTPKLIDFPEHSLIFSRSAKLLSTFLLNFAHLANSSCDDVFASSALSSRTTFRSALWRFAVGPRNIEEYTENA
jgi:hypothetical protein